MRCLRSSRVALAAPGAALSGCSGVQSALDPAGEEAVEVARLFWTMAAGGAVIWIMVVGLLLYAARPDRRVFGERPAGRVIFWGGAVFPTLTLLCLLAYALWLMPGLRPFAQAAEPRLRIEVGGSQFWWRVAYRPAGGGPIPSANEVRLPVGERVELELASEDVIHSFWIPALAGKMDMIPGRKNRLSVLATKPGIYRGPCAEYCGTSHALMAFTVVAMEPADFTAWLDAQRQPTAGEESEGARLFLEHGCGACHAIRGTEATGVVGPDLSDLGARQTIGAGILPNDEETIARFIAGPDVVKPGSKMPAFGMLPDGELRAIAAYLAGLK